MKVPGVVLALTLLSGQVVAQQEFLSRLPECAVWCFSSNTPQSCSADDFSCLCADTTFMTTVTTCNAACDIPVRDKTKILIGPVASIGALALLMVSMRLIDRFVSAQSQLGWDDLLIWLSGVVSIGMNVPVIVAASLGFGRDMWGIPADNITKSLKWLYVAYFMYMLAEALCQMSILAFYLRIMVEPRLRIVVWILLGVVTCFGIANVFAMIFQCTPIPFFWDGWRGEMAGFCGVDVRLFGFARGGIEIFLDLAILTLPLPMLAKLNMSPKKKLQIMSMFCVGFIITVSNLFTVVACMPALHAIFHKMLRKVRGISTYASRGQYGSERPSKGSYLRHNTDQHKNLIPFGAIKKATDVTIYRTERSSSDVELVDNRRPA
ncbi:hypothetical protein E8E12_002329 [Didymella heteroderae]|uniref:Extracellular membrane protein CFEM domain-containing protein n=1 Tax=Didymella heteroderae TaxID=1769908 RepID=A0A9P4WGP4_9PLEO|nr:hypothetical protein E8E12_002329 [Didymella heteroderae]